MISLSFYEKELKIFHYLNITGTIKHSYNNKNFQKLVSSSYVLKFVALS